MKSVVFLGRMISPPKQIIENPKALPPEATASGPRSNLGVAPVCSKEAGAETFLRLLHLEDNPKDCFLVQAMLEDAGLACRIKAVKTRAEFEQALHMDVFDLVISDISLPAYNGLAALAHVRAKLPSLPFILFSGTIGEEVAVESLQKGATDYVLKQRPERLAAAVRRAMEEVAERAERLKAEEQIREQAALLDKANDAICVIGLDQTILYWNKGAERIYGWAADDALGHKLSGLLFKAPSALPAEAFEEVVRDNEWRGELRQISKHGQEILVESRWAPVFDLEGNFKSILLINSDITEKRNLEIQLQRGQRLENIGMLASGIAHDLNNVLAPMLMALPLLHAQEPDPVKQTMLETLDQSAQRGKGLVQQILSFAKGTATERKVIQAERLISDLGKIIQETFPKSISFHQELQADLWPVEMNSIQLHQVLLNLCVNARDAMPAGGTLTIRACNTSLNEVTSDAQFERKAGSYLVLSVEDTGTGMPPEVLNKIFDPFFTTKGADRGTGLGLSTVANIIKASGGFLEVKSQVGIGTTFRVHLPAARSARPVEAKKAQSELPSGNGEMILLVDDEAAIRQIMKATLEAFGYVVRTAEDGVEALSVYSRDKDKISLVATDMEMPFMNGPELISALRKSSPFLKVIIISGLGKPAMVTDHEADGSVGFLQKPYSTEQLLRALTEALKGELKAA